MLEYVNGGELFSMMQRTGKLQTPAAQFYASEILLAIEYLHSYSILYRGVCACACVCGP